MLKKAYLDNHPLRLIGFSSEDILPGGGFGALLAHAGVGKTAFLVHIALHGLLRNKNVLHISINDPVEKVCRWYEEVFRKVAFQYNMKLTDQFWETILPQRFIMTFKIDAFSVPKLEERITDLTEQGIFLPQMIVIDSLPFDETARKTFVDLKSLAQKLGLHIWFTVRTHLHEKPGTDGIPMPLLNVADLFEVALDLRPESKEIQLHAIKGAPPEFARDIILDPSTMMLKNSAA